MFCTVSKRGKWRPEQYRGGQVKEHGMHGINLGSINANRDLEGELQP